MILFNILFITFRGKYNLNQITCFHRKKLRTYFRQRTAFFRQIGRTEPQVKLTERSAEHVWSVSAERSAEPFGVGRTLVLDFPC